MPAKALLAAKVSEIIGAVGFAVFAKESDMTAGVREQHTDKVAAVRAAELPFRQAKAFFIGLVKSLAPGRGHKKTTAVRKTVRCNYADFVIDFP